MRILILSAPLEIQGPLPKLVPLLMDALRDLGCEVVFEPWGRHSDSESLLAKIVGRTKDIFRIRSRLRYDEFDVVVVHTSHFWPALLRDVPLLLSTCRIRPVTVIEFHGSQPNRLLSEGDFLFKLLSAWLTRMCDAVLVLSSEELRQWEQVSPTGRFFLVSNPSSQDLPGTVAAPTPSWDIPEDVPVLLFVGRLIPEKGILDLLASVAFLQEQSPCHLLVAGDGAGVQEVQERIAALDLGDCVTMAGYLKDGELATAYRTATLLVLPTYWNEGFPLVITEAMSAGLPVVTTPTRGVVDHLQEEVNVLYVPPRDPVILADKLARLLADPELRARMSKANREKVEEFAPEVVGQHYLGVLEDIVAAGQADRRSRC